MLSVWERNSFTRYQYVIIGSGIVGLCTAFYLKKKDPLARILVLERGLLPSGASTRNAGFACMGSLTEILDDLVQQSEEEVVALFELRKKGLERLLGLLGKNACGYEAQGSYELISASESGELDKMDYCNRLLMPLLGMHAFRMADEKIQDFGFNKSKVDHLVENTCEGSLDSGMMMKALLQLVQESGVEIRTGCKVLSFEDGKEVTLLCQDPVRDMPLPVYCNRLFICTNAFAPQLMPTVDVVPGRGQVLLTHPIPGLPFKGTFHFDRGYYYFREYRGCVLLGGGRHHFREEESDTALTLNTAVQDHLLEKLREIILPGRKFSIDMKWSGIMAFGSSKAPIIQRMSDHVFAAVRMGGMGVAIGSEVAYRVVDMHSNC